MKFPDTQFLRAFSILLIVNSHLDYYYPIKQLATGGAIGNSIFFFLSAFGIYLSQQNRNKLFGEFMAGRISRIYPAMWIVLILLILPLRIVSGRLSTETIIPFIGNFFNPPFWFLQTLMVYYLLSFYFIKHDPHSNKKTPVLVLLGFLSVLYFSSYFTWVDLNTWSVEKTPFDRIHYFMLFVFGIYVAMQNKSVVYTGIGNYFAIMTIVMLIYAHKFMMTKGLFPELQFIQQAAMYPLVYYLLKVCRSPLILKQLTQSKRISPVVNFLSNHTLEIYMIHEALNRPVLKLELAFPLNVIVFVTLTFILSAIVKKLAGVLWQKINKPPNNCTPGNCNSKLQTDHHMSILCLPY